MASKFSPANMKKISEISRRQKLSANKDPFDAVSYATERKLLGKNIDFVAEITLNGESRRLLQHIFVKNAYFFSLFATIEMLSEYNRSIKWNELKQNENVKRTMPDDKAGLWNRAVVLIHICFGMFGFRWDYSDLFRFQFLKDRIATDATLYNLPHPSAQLLVGIFLYRLRIIRKNGWNAIGISFSLTIECLKDTNAKVWKCRQWRYCWEKKRAMLIFCNSTDMCWGISSDEALFIQRLKRLKFVRAISSKRRQI